MPQTVVEVNRETTRHDLPPQVREARLEPATFNAAEGTVEVVWTQGARVQRYDFWADTRYEEELAVTSDAVDMSRFEAGTVQVLDGHRTREGVAAIIGVAVRGWIAGGEGRALIRLSRRPEMAGIVQDIKDGVIRAISFGYSVTRYEVTPPKQRTDGGLIPLYRAVAWQPQEISFVPVPADPGAGTRSQPAQGQPCEFTRATAQPSQEATVPVDNTPVALTAEQQAQRATDLAAERQRGADISALCSKHGIAAERAAKFITEGVALDAVRAAILDDIATRDEAAGGTRQNVRIETLSDEVQTRREGMEEAVLNRIDPKAKLTDKGRQFRGMSLLEMGRDWLELRGLNTRGKSRMELAGDMLHFRSPGMMSTGDFANLFANVANKRLRGSYDENMPTYRTWARRAPNAPDFKSMSVVNLAAAPDLLRTNEHGEFKYGSMTDGAETYSMLTYGRIVSMTRQAIVNDDLRGFDRLIGAFGASATRLENRTVYAILTANAALADTGALFNATAVTTAGGHANLAGTPAVINVANLQIGRLAMRLQKGLQSEELNIAPRFLIVPAALEQVAYQYTSAAYVPATSANINEFRAGGRTSIEPVVEAILDANSATAWYLAADSAAIDTVEFCHLDGAEGPVIDSQVGFDIDGIAYKCRLDFAAKAIDFRGLWKNAGV